MWWLLLVGILLSCYLLVAELPMFALKFKHFGWKGNGLKYGFILLSAILLIALGWAGFSAVILCYILLSVVNNKCSK
jgi:CDP-diacylglycerol--serine O-phosphatidyltransferase